MRRGWELGLLNPEEDWGGSHLWVQTPKGKVQRGWSQPLLSGAQCQGNQDKRQWADAGTQEVLSECQEAHCHVGG